MIETIETERLLLRPMTFDDVDLLVELDSDADVMRYITGRPSTRQEVEAAIREQLGRRWMAIEKTSAAFVGWFGLVSRSDRSYEVGYRLHRASWGQGLATEGTTSLIDAAFGLLGAESVTAQTMAVNLRSRAVMERCGMRHTRTLHLEWDDPLPGNEEGEVEYEIMRNDWEALKAKRA